MGSVPTTGTELPAWTQRPPQAFDIVTGFYPEVSPTGGKPKCRPLLVTDVLRKRATGEILCSVAYGTSSVRSAQFVGRHLIVGNTLDLDDCGLLHATRFNVDRSARVNQLWDPANFCTWSGKSTPVIGRLSEDLQKEFAYLMMKQMAQDAEAGCGRSS